MPLVANQIDLIKKELQGRGLLEGPLSEEFVDHVCCDVEERMSAGENFQLAIRQILSEIDPKQVQKYQLMTARFRKYKPIDMLQNHITSTIRNFRRNKTYSFLNVLGLALGITSFVFLFQYLRFELSYDKFHGNSNDIYRVRVDQFFPGTPPMRFAVAFVPVGPDMVDEIPEVIDYVTMNKLAARGVMTYFPPNAAPVKYDQNEIFFASTDFFKVFSFELVKGDPATALKETNQVVITESEARKYFGDEDPLGKTLLKDGNENFKVTGVVKDPPQNSHLKFKMLLSFETMLTGRDWMRDNWGWWDFYTYIQTQPGTNPAILQKKVDAFEETHIGERNRQSGARTEFIMQPLTDIHLTSNVGYEHEPNGNIKTVYFLGIIAVFILGLAWVNYISLSTSRSLERAKEVGLRKTLGSPRLQIMQQFIVESLALNTLAVMLGISSAWLLKPIFSQFLGFDLPFTLDVTFWTLAMGLVLAGTLLSGTYPAFVISSFSPLAALMKSSTSERRGFPMRKVMVVFQMAISIILIAFTFGVQRQVIFMTNHDLGMNIDKILVLKGPGIRDSTYSTKLNGFKSGIQNNHLVKQIVSSSDVPGKEIEWSEGFDIKGKDPDKSIVMRIMGVDYSFLDVYNVRMLAGRRFGTEAPGDTVCIINSTAVKAMGIDNPEDVLGLVLETENSGTHLRVIGVADDFKYRGLSNETEPVIFWGSDSWSGYYSVKLNLGDDPHGNIGNMISLAKEQWDEHFPESPFDYFFLDDFFNDQYNSEARFGKIFGLFSTLAIAIACLGLFGLSSYTVSRRTREIGIRKVLGASVPNILLLLSRNYMVLMLISFVIAVPASYLGITRWLNEFPLKFEPDPLLFIYPGMIVFVLMILIISYQTFATARSNPVDSIRTE